MSNKDWVDDLSEAIGEIAIISGAAILGGLLLKAIFDRDTNIHRCPKCNLVIMKGTPRCPRCGTLLDWKGVI
jgi:rubrerythrin